MFRDPRAARRATGILASSAPLMTAAQKAVAQNEPMRAQTGAAVNTRNRLFDPAQIMRGIQYPLEYFGMPVPESAPGVPVGNALQDLNRFLYGTETRQSPVQSGLRAADEATRRATAQIMRATDQAAAQTMGEPLPGVTSENIQAAGRGIVGLFTPQYVGGEMTGPELAAAQAARPAPLPSTGLPETSELTGPELAAAQAMLPDTSRKADEKAPVLKPTPKPKRDEAPEAVAQAKQARNQLAALRGDPASEEMNLLTTGTAEQRVGPSGGQPERQEDVAAFGLEYAEMVKPEEVSLSDIEARAKEIMGFDPEKATEDRKNSFWMNLTRAGLAIAAGESDNALTNVAKGLSFGLDAYAKDISQIDERDEAQRREYRDTLRSMIKDEKDGAIAQAQMINSYNQSVNALKQNAAIAAQSDMTQRELAQMSNQTRREIAAAQNAISSQSLEIQLQTAISRMDIDIARLESDADYRDKKLKSDEIYRTQVLAMDEWKSQPDLVKIGKSIGFLDENDEWTTEGWAWATNMATKSLAGTSKELQAATAKRFAQDALKNDELVFKASEDMKVRAKMDREPTLAELTGYFEALTEGTLDEYFSSLLVASQ